MKPGYMLSAMMTLAAGSLMGQAVPRPAFEVASIKPAGPFSLDKMFAGQIHTARIKGLEATFQFVSLTDLLTYAYRVKPYQIAGPTWMGDGRWTSTPSCPKGARPLLFRK